MLIAGSVIAALAALLHVLIFWMESLSWTSARSRATFGMSREEAENTREMAFNQGFYNLFLAVMAALGVVLTVCGVRAAGAALMLAGVGSMLAAAIVLFASSPDKRGAALKQGTLPLLAVALIVLAVV
ncbi:DUF1304 domain-containing protein [Propionibacterium australiense]|uniref:DUF1304 family protein n=1 Tax=Propionibacterium australiense TaxID=119981 RepID=A0A383S6E3_9ACTN|nr:DUF1304 domain-containing protein [Propionibacterium australiense]RLP09653.1 DUF1304 family protein [Propionibacterium australiense]RLP12355.1 DUF1304 family protein [Propionibacterium australiense]SYZ33560.1 Protein of unknown function DUF1304 [Propionibacterium australiense]VEH89573.1 Predicted membrane protein [Propionibacterium australiense]